ncbi:MAG: replication protein [Christensenellaceae bacterium]|nr:replication protein [Christensenellaceae bacterium]
MEQLTHIISSTDIKSYAYILHDKDKDDNGELKKPHYHFLIQFNKNQRGAWFKQFSTDDMGIVFVQTCHDPLSAFSYLIHDTPTAKKQKKYLYAPTERISTIDTFETEDKPDENTELYNDLIDLLNNKITWHELIRKKPKRIHMIANIKVAYDMLYFEAYGHRFFDFNSHYRKPPKSETPEPPKIQPPKIDLVPIVDDPNMPW